MSDVYVLGVDMIKFGRFPDRTVPDLGAEAALLALDDAGLNIGNMEAFYCGNLGQANAMVGQRILQEIGQTGIPVVNCSNACATGATAFREAWTSIKAGLYDVVLAVGLNKWEQDFLEELEEEPGYLKKDYLVLELCLQYLLKLVWNMPDNTGQLLNNSQRYL